jgi:hypothetical protein
VVLTRPPAQNEKALLAHRPDFLFGKVGKLYLDLFVCPDGNDYFLDGHVNLYLDLHRKSIMHEY